MKRFRDVHVHAVPGSAGWRVKQGRRTLSGQTTQTAAVRAARRAARRDHVELVTHGRDGRIRSKDSHGRDSRTRDTER